MPPFPGDGVGYFWPGLKSVLLPTIEPSTFSILTTLEEEEEEDDDEEDDDDDEDMTTLDDDESI